MGTVLITGATGFLGGALAERLAADGHTVRALVRTSSDRSRLQRLGAEFAPGDVTDAGSVTEALRGVDRVFHSAAMVGFDPAQADRLRSVNVEGARHVLTAAAEHEIPAIHVSSAAALGETGPEIRDETWWHPDEPEWIYEQTKRDAHQIARDLADGGADVRVGIPGGIYGAGDDSDLGKAIRFYLDSPVSVGWLPTTRHSTVHVDDCASGLIAIAERGRPGEEYVLCAESITMGDWIPLIRRAAGRKPPRFWIHERGVRRFIGLADGAAALVGRDAGRVTGTARMAMRNFAFTGAKATAELDWHARPLLAGLRELAILPA